MENIQMLNANTISKLRQYSYDQMHHKIIAIQCDSRQKSKEKKKTTSWNHQSNETKNDWKMQFCTWWIVNMHHLWYCVALSKLLWCSFKYTIKSSIEHRWRYLTVHLMFHFVPYHRNRCQRSIHIQTHIEINMNTHLDAVCLSILYFRKTNIGTILEYLNHEMSGFFPLLTTLFTEKIH